MHGWQSELTKSTYIYIHKVPKTDFLRQQKKINSYNVQFESIERFLHTNHTKNVIYQNMCLGSSYVRYSFSLSPEPKTIPVILILIHTIECDRISFFMKNWIKMTAHFMRENMKSISIFRRLFILLFDSFEFCSPSKLNKMNYCDSLEIRSLLKLEIFYFIDYYYYRFHSKRTSTLFLSLRPHDRREQSRYSSKIKTYFYTLKSITFHFLDFFWVELAIEGRVMAQ